MNTFFKNLLVSSAVSTVYAFGTCAAYAQEGPGVLKASFVYSPSRYRMAPDNESRWKTLVDAGVCTQTAPPPRSEKDRFYAGTLSPFVVDVIAKLVGSAAKSVMSATAARMTAEDTKLTVVVPLDGYFDKNGETLVNDACLVVYNGSDLKTSSMVLGLNLKPSYDKTAVRFVVNKWEFSRFFRPESSKWLQHSDSKDFLLKISLVPPGADATTHPAVFFESRLDAVSAQAMKTAFYTGQDLPWLQAPVAPAALKNQEDNPLIPAGVYMPLNLQVEVVETSRPYQLATWMSALVTEKSDAVTKSFEDSTRQALDPVTSADAQNSLMTVAATAFNTYKTKWDALLVNLDSKPAPTMPGASESMEKKYQADLIAWGVKFDADKKAVSNAKTLAQVSYSNGSIPWPGDLPDLVR